MTTLTDKELIKEIKERISSLDVRDNIERRAYEIALASLEADPVKRVNSDQMRRVCLEANRHLDKYDAMAKEVNKLLGRIAPPAPVVPEEATPENVEMLSGYVSTYKLTDSERDIAAEIWNACRAAMLQGSQPVSQTYKLPVNTPCQDAPAHIWLQTAGVWPEDGELSELTWCSHNQHHDDTLYVRADLVNGNSPVTPDGWVMVPKELTPEMMRAVQIRSELGGYATSNLSGAYNMFSEFWNVAVSAAPKVDDL